MTFTKQFIIMDQPLDVQDFQHVTLSCGKILSYHKNLHIQIVQNESGASEICLLGWAFQAEEGRNDPLEQIREIKDRAELERQLETWSGTWLLIYDKYIYLDACGLLGCFYTDSGIVSSSLSCINEAMHRKSRNPRLRHNFGLDYYPGSGTVYPDTYRLMPSQTYDLIDRKYESRSLYLGNKNYETDEQRLDTVIHYFETILRNLVRTYNGRIMLPLTGGYDSRTMMALLEYSGIDYSAFTLEHENISELDREAPPELAKIMNRRYEYRKREGKKSKERLQDFDRHCDGMAADEDRNFYAYDQYPHDEKMTAILRCGVWECNYYTIYNWVEKADLNLKKYAKKYVNIRWRKDMQDSLQRYFDYVKTDEQPLKWPVRFYREQRMGCWLSSTEQALTLIPNMDSFQLCNCSCILEILGGVDLELLKGKKYQVRIIEKICPQLLQVTLQNKENKFPKKRLFKSIKKDFQYIKNCWCCLDGNGRWKEPLKFVKKKLWRNK